MFIILVSKSLRFLGGIELYSLIFQALLLRNDHQLDTLCTSARGLFGALNETARFIVHVAEIRH